MTLWRCQECTTAYAVGLSACPHCRSTEYEEDGTMPKITRHGGPSIADAQVVGGAWSDGTDQDQWPADETGEGEQSSPGSSSETFSARASNSSATSKPGSPKRARTTGSRSARARTGDSTAPSTGGGQTAPTSETTSASDDS